MTLIKVNPEWKQFIVYEGRKHVPTIYSEAIKTLYGILDATKLFYNNFSSFLVSELGFKENLYDMCVVNKEIKDSQCTIMWYDDNLKISHMEHRT